MQLPKENASYNHRANYGAYVARRLRRAKLMALYSAVAAATKAVKDAGRARDDAEEVIQECLADRDAVDIDLDTCAKTIRVNMAGRSVDAVKVEPYIQVFPDGIAFYTNATLDQEVSRYTELAERLQKYLPADDVCREQLPVIAQGIADFKHAEAAVAQARRTKSQLQTDLDTAEDKWERLMERTYGALIDKFGKGPLVESFFPKQGRTSSSQGDSTPSA